MKLSHVLLALGAVASVGEARFERLDCGVGELCGHSRGGTCLSCVSLSEVDDDGFVNLTPGYRGFRLYNPETGEVCLPGPFDAPYCLCGPKQICTREAFTLPGMSGYVRQTNGQNKCAPRSCKSARLRRNLGRWDWYTGKSNKMPSALKNFASNQKYGMSKIVGPQDAAGTILGNIVANHFFDEDEEDDLGFRL